MTALSLLRALLLGALVISVTPCVAGPLLDRIQARMQGGPDASSATDEMSGGGGAMPCSEWSRKVDRIEALAKRANPGPKPDRANLLYGAAPREQLDVYLPKTATGAAPVILMVHGGGWCVGDKAAAGVTENKVKRWTAAGFVFVSINYPMVGDGADARAQANFVAHGAAYVQAHARAWGGDPARLILMGHSAGAHLVSLVNADAGIRHAAGLRPLLGVVSLDAGAIDVPRQMPQVYPFLKIRYREAFGDTEAQWRAASPYHALDGTAAPWLGVCSTTRKDDPCGQARAYADKSNSLGVHAAVLPQPLNHGALNKDLGELGDYTRQVEAFMAGLDGDVAQRLARVAQTTTSPR